MMNLPGDLASLIRSRVSSGDYDSEESVLHAAMEALAQQEASQDDADMASIKRGLADFSSGRYRPADEAEAEFRDRRGLGSN